MLPVALLDVFAEVFTADASLDIALLELQDPVARRHPAVTRGVDPSADWSPSRSQPDLHDRDVRRPGGHSKGRHRNLRRRATGLRRNWPSFGLSRIVTLTAAFLVSIAVSFAIVLFGCILATLALRGPGCEWVKRWRSGSLHRVDPLVACFAGSLCGRALVAGRARGRHRASPRPRSAGTQLAPGGGLLVARPWVHAGVRTLARLDRSRHGVRRHAWSLRSFSSLSDAARRRNRLSPVISLMGALRSSPLCSCQSRPSE